MENKYDDDLNRIYKLREELAVIGEKLKKAGLLSDDEDEYDENDPYAWLKPSSPKFYRQLTRSFKKDLKKKAREEKKRKKKMKGFSLITENQGV